MAIAFDKTGSANTVAGTTVTLSSFAATSDNSIAIIYLFKDTGDTVTGVTVNGNAATYVNKQNLTGTQWGYIYYYLNPPTSAVNYVATSSASSYWDIAVSIYSGAKQSGQPDSNNTGSASPSVTLSTTVVASDCWLASYARNTVSGVPAAGTGTTSRGTTSLFRYGDSNGTVGTGAQTMQYTAAAGTTGGIIVSIAPSVAGGSVNSNFFAFM